MKRIFVTALLLGLPGLGLASSQINRCIDAAGNTIYTDRTCAEHAARDVPLPSAIKALANEELDASFAVASAHGFTSGRLPHPHLGCAATPQDLAQRLHAALQSRDVNQLSSLYHWPGSGGRSADSILASLRRTAAQGAYGVDVEGGYATATSGFGEPGMRMMSTAAPPAPTGLRVEHAPAHDGYASASTRFGITRHMGCWWIHY